MLLRTKAFTLTKTMRKSRKGKGSVMISSNPFKTPNFTSLFFPKTTRLRFFFMVFGRACQDYGVSQNDWAQCLPVFYDLEPTEIRKQNGAVGEAFAKHENEEAARKWRVALKEAADMAGWELKNTLDG
ncbi:toll/interleukin-1 receptor (TIR) domain-containing protein [Artemisia annua]|uniref:Toll/interleukin-1 receptor (TIR) domain-containing protein n=1 Tax=Artemisia annua TaxID=35608 RepID=A0A2U1QB07_ARTAN|nr:toll/interleukin-1 receptor (TIR) domain-containing protein [Artemisia annua]